MEGTLGCFDAHTGTATDDDPLGDVVLFVALGSESVEVGAAVPVAGTSGDTALGTPCHSATAAITTAAVPAAARATVRRRREVWMALIT
jgi:hypothetical protein